MGKKNLAGLMAGIIGESSPSMSPSEANNPPAEEKSKEVSTKPGPGRPSKKKEPETAATFLVSDILLKKLKYICYADGVMQKEIINSALSAYIENWEKENGNIVLPVKKHKG